MNSFHKKNSAIAMGNFDGFHLGHQKIVETLSDIANRKRLVSVVLTFTPNPKIFFKKEKRLIISDSEKKKLLEALGVDRVAFVDFERYYLMDGLTFIKKVLIGQFSMAHIIVGENFKFGVKRSDDIESLKTFSRVFHFDVTIVQPESLKGTVISSSLIRKKLAEGQVDLANQMLGRCYFIDGVVSRGNKIGTSMGIPTININAENLILPGGVFKTSVKIGSRTYDSVTNIGSKPTFDRNGKGIESHILNFNGMIYGKQVRIFFKKKIRNEKKFNSKMELIQQIKKDLESITVDKDPHF